ncbi:MAG: hypothetical protein OXN89_24305 [Bryobacterales bacterium]|nr:hypothetical protein [Bryobacterales bacterium]
MIRHKQIAAIATAVMVTAGIAFSQNNPDAQQRRENISAAVQSVGLSQDQIAKIREIRRVRPAEDADRAARRALRQDKASKIQALLTDAQKAKVKELRAAGTDSKAFQGAVLLGLTAAPPRN